MRMFQKMQRRAASLRHLLWRYAMVTTASFLLLMVGLVLFSPILDVRTIKVQRLDARMNAEQIHEVLIPWYHQHLLLLVPEQVRRAIDTTIPDADTITIKKQYPSTLVVAVTPDPLIARLTITNPNITTGTGQLTTSGSLQPPIDYLTNKGVYVSYPPNQVQTGTGILDIQVVDWAVRPEIGKQMVQSGFLLAMQRAEKTLGDEFGLTVENRTLFLRAREFHLRVPGYSLWFDIRSPIEEQFERYRIFLNYVALASVKEYVDLRIRKMIVYK